MDAFVFGGNASGVSGAVAVEDLTNITAVGIALLTAADAFAQRDLLYIQEDEFKISWNGSAWAPARSTMPAGFVRAVYDSGNYPAATNPYTSADMEVGDRWLFAEGGGPFV